MPWGFLKSWGIPKRNIEKPWVYENDEHGLTWSGVDSCINLYHSEKVGFYSRTFVSVREFETDAPADEWDFTFDLFGGLLIPWALAISASRFFSWTRPKDRKYPAKTSLSLWPRALQLSYELLFSSFQEASWNLLLFRLFTWLVGQSFFWWTVIASSDMMIGRNQSTKHLNMERMTFWPLLLVPSVDLTGRNRMAISNHLQEIWLCRGYTPY